MNVFWTANSNKRYQIKCVRRRPQEELVHVEAELGGSILSQNAKCCSALSPVTIYYKGKTIIELIIINIQTQFQKSWEMIC